MKKPYQVSPTYDPYQLAELFYRQQLEAGGRVGSLSVLRFLSRSRWSTVDEFWQRATAALALIPRLQDDERFKASSRLMNVNVFLNSYTRRDSRADNHEMVRNGAGYHITLAHQHGVLSHHLIPFFILLATTSIACLPNMPATYPWIDFPARYEELTDRRYDFPDFALIPRQARHPGPREHL